MNIDTISASTDGQVQELPPQLRSTAAAPASAFPAGPINILIVDDEPKNLNVLESVLNDPSYRLVRAESANQALHALVAEEFALLILDIRMPGMTGFELANMIKERKRTARVPIIFLTAYNEDQHVLEGYGSATVDYLVKPVNPAILRSKVAAFAELHRKNCALLAGVTVRRRGEEQLRELNETFEQRVTERAEALCLREASYRDLIQLLPAALYTCDERGRITLYNEAAVALWGREPEVGRDLWCGSWKIYRPDGTPLPLDECPMAVTLREGRAIRGVEIVIERPDGTRRHVLAHPEPLRDAEGVVVGAINMLTDVSEIHKAERAIAHLAAIVMSSEDAIISKNLQGIVMSWNRAAERLFDYTAEEMIGQPVSLLIPPDRHDEEPGILERINRGESIENYETIRRRKDGSDLPISLTVSPLIDHHGKIIGASKIARNITEQKRVERALIDSRDELRCALEFKEAVVSSMGEGLYTVNDQGLVTSVNKAAQKLFGWTREELLGRKMHDVTHYKHRDGTPFPAEECASFQVLCGGKALTNYEDVFIRKDGTFFDVVYSSSPMLASGKIAGLVVVFRDVSAQKRAEEALQERDRALSAANDALTKQKVALAEANKELEGFSYSVSHDLRAPLRTIDAFSRIVEEDHGPHLNADARRSLAIVRKAAGQAGELIDDLLEFSKLGRQGMNLRLVRMADLAREAADDLKLLQEGRQVELTIGDLPSCQGDRRYLKLVWINLLTNAFKYTKNRTESRIEVGWMADEASAEAVTYYVKDDGIGFDMKYAHKLFGVFQRLHRKEDFDGTGVGLAIVQRIVHRHGGRVWAEGKVGGGATFFVSLRKAEHDERDRDIIDRRQS